jgi:hypothetical protein
VVGLIPERQLTVVPVTVATATGVAVAVVAARGHRDRAGDDDAAALER